MKGYVSALFLFCVCTAAHATPHKIEFSDVHNTLTVKTEKCLYGRGVQQQLKQQSFDDLHEHLRQNAKSYVKDLGYQFKLKRAKQEYIELLLTTKLESQSLRHSFSLIGNDTCTNASVTFPIDDNIDFKQLFEFAVPSTLHFVDTNEGAKEKITQQLNELNIKVDWQIIPDYLLQHASFNVNNVANSYYQFELASYQSAVSQAINTVYIEGDAQITPLLKQYLQSNEFDITASPNDAFWQLKVAAVIEQEKFLTLKLSIKNQDNQSSLLVNNSRQLPPVNLSQPAILAKFAKVHFELMKLKDALTL